MTLTASVTPPAGPAAPDPRSIEREDRRRFARAGRYLLRDGLYRVSSLPRTRKCGRLRVPGAEGVEVRVNDDGVAGYAKVQTCGSVWSCPACSARIRQARAVELQAAAEAWSTVGGGLLHVTLTVPHTRGQDLAQLLEVVASSWRAVQQGTGWRKCAEAVDVAGYVRAAEITYGARSGWHPHLHVLLFLRNPPTPAVAERVAGALEAAWGSAVVKRGLSRPSSAHGVVVQTVGAGAGALAQYLSKVQDEYGDAYSVGMELTRGDLKAGKKAGRHMPFGLAKLAVDGDAGARYLWQEYEQATKGRRCLTWSHGLRQLLGAGAEVDDETLAGDAAGECVAVVSDGDWWLVVRQGKRHKLLDAAERAGRDGVKAFLERVRRRELARTPAGRAMLAKLPPGTAWSRTGAADHAAPAVASVARTSCTG